MDGGSATALPVKRAKAAPSASASDNGQQSNTLPVLLGLRSRIRPHLLRLVTRFLQSDVCGAWRGCGSSGLFGLSHLFSLTNHRDTTDPRTR